VRGVLEAVLPTAIAGATITSRAVGKAINDSAQALLPRLVPNLDKLRSKS